MTKRILALLSALVLVLSLLPVGVIAEGNAPAAHTESHVCEHCPEGTAATWTAWDGTTALVDGGHYYLENDVTLATPVALSEGSYVLCLGGKTLTATGGRHFNLSGTAQLTIVDCTATGEGEDYTAGTVTGATGSAINLTGTAGITIYDGVFSGNRYPDKKGNGGVILMNQASGSVTVKGGMFRDNYADYGAAIYMDSRTSYVTLTVENAYFTGNGGYHTGTIHFQHKVDASFKDTTITGNSITGGNSAGIYTTNANARITLSGKVVVDGNTNSMAAGKENLRNIILGVAAIKLNIDQLAAGSKVQFHPHSSITDPNAAINVIAQDSWDCNWLTMDADPISHDDKNSDSKVDNGEFLAGHYHDGVKYSAINAAALPTVAGNYYLPDDVTLDSTWNVTQDLNLCLNGHSLTTQNGSRIIKTFNANKVTVVIDDCTAYTDDSGVYHAGTLSGATDYAISAATGSSIILKNGILTGNSKNSAVLVNGTMEMTGGEISGNSAPNGGAIFVNANASFTMTGGTIKNNTASNRAGAIYVNQGTLTVSGGEITGNSAVSGGAIYLNKGTAYIQGSSITGNTATANGGAIFAPLNTVALHVSGNPDITGNTVDGKANNLYLEGDTLTMTVGEMAETATVGVSGVPCRPISGETADSSAKFISDSTFYSVIYQDGKLYLDMTERHEHCCCAAAGTGCDHTSILWMPWESTTALPTEGVFYLTADVVLTETVTASGDLQLCLNGHTVSGPDGVYILATTKDSNQTVVISDCTAEGALVGTGNTGSTGLNIRPGSTVKLYGGKLTGCYSATGGGAALVNGTLEMFGGEISGNESAVNGGALFVNATGTFIQHGGVIKDNTATGKGGAAYVLGSVQLLGGTVESNSANAGGGLYGYTGTITVDGGTVANNTSATNGGAIAAEKGAIVAVKNGSITGNKAPTSGGGVFLTGEGTVLTVSGGQIAKNSAKYGGGVITQTKSSLKLEGGKISNNTSSSNGGGVYISTNTTLTMTGGEISGNRSNLNGGGIYFLKSNLKMSGGKISGNSAKADGGAMYLYISNASFTGGSVTGNSAKNAGGIRIGGGTTTISGLYVGYNAATTDGGGIMLGRQMVKENGVNVNKMPNVNIYGGTFEGNTAKNGAGLLLLSQGSVTNISGVTIKNNEAVNGGGGIYTSTGATLNMKNSKLLNNNAKTGANLMHLLSSGNYENVEINGGTGNNAPGIMVNKPAENGKGITLKNVKVLNTTGAASGAVVVQGGAVMHMDGCEVSGNATEKTGGGIFTTTAAKSYIKNTTFHNNTAGADAGGIMIGLNSFTSLENCTITGNNASGNGGGIFNRGQMEITNCTIDGNSAGSNGGGIGSGKTGSVHTGNACGITITGATITNNTAGGNGGGLHGATGCHYVASDLTITGNKAEQGSAVWASEDFSCKNLTATGNSGGHAVYFAKSNFDGQSYLTGFMKLSGKLVIKDNEGGGVFINELQALTLAGNGLEEGSELLVTLSDGLLTQRVRGVYHYEGEGLTWTLTPGERSITEPMAVENAPVEDPTEEPTETPTQPNVQDQPKGNGGLIAGIIGLFAVVIAAAAAVIVLVNKKKKAQK